MITITCITYVQKGFRFKLYFEVIDKITFFFHENCPKFYILTKIVLKVLEKDRPTTCILKIICQEHVKNIFFLKIFLPVVTRR